MVTHEAPSLIESLFLLKAIETILKGVILPQFHLERNLYNKINDIEILCTSPEVGVTLAAADILKLISKFHQQKLNSTFFNFKKK